MATIRAEKSGVRNPPVPKVAVKNEGDHTTYLDGHGNIIPKPGSEGNEKTSFSAIIRHGELSSEGFKSNEYDPPLSSEGVKQSKITGGYLFKYFK